MTTADAADMGRKAQAAGQPRDPGLSGPFQRRLAYLLRLDPGVDPGPFQDAYVRGWDEGKELDREALRRGGVRRFGARP